MSENLESGSEKMKFYKKVIKFLKRKESRGAHFRTDYQFTNDVAEHTCMVKGETGLVFVA